MCPKNPGDFKKITGKNPTSFKNWIKQYENVFQNLKIPPPPKEEEDDKKDEQHQDEPKD